MKKRQPQGYPDYARKKMPVRQLIRENNWGWRYPPEGGVCLWRKMWIDYFEEERRRPDPSYRLAQRMNWNYPPRRKRVNS